MIRISLISALLVAFVLGGTIFSASPAQAQLEEVKQTVYGMDCAPCAHAMESRLGNTEGVSGVTVSLNGGLATIDLTPNNQLTLGALREAVVNGGFSPKEATVRLTGVVKQQNEHWIVSLDSGETYLLDQTDASAGLEEMEPETQVTVTGTVDPESESETTDWTLQVQRLDSTG